MLAGYYHALVVAIDRSSHSEVFLRKGILKIYSKFTGQHPYRSVISIKLQSNFIEITLRYECSPANLLHFFGKTFLKNSSGRLLLQWILFQIDFKHELNICSVNNFCIWGLEVWKTYVDKQPVFNHYGSHSHVHLYFCKAEDEKSKTMKQAANNAYMGNINLSQRQTLLMF